MQEASISKQETILVVDDNRQIASIMADKVIPSLGFQTITAYDGKSALDIIRKRDIALILLDLQLPDIDGLEVLKCLAQEGRSIPTILVTAHGSEQVAVEAFRLGVQDYLSKPVDPDKLEAAMTRALRETRLRREKAILTAQLKEQVSWLTALMKVGQSLTTTLELDDVLRRIVEAGVLLTHAEEGFIALLDEPTGQLYLRAVKNIDQDKIKTVRIPVSDQLISSCFRTRRPVRKLVEEGNPLLKVSTGFLVSSLLHVPLVAKDQAMGVLSMVHRTGRSEFNEKDEIVLTSLADYAATAIENARLYHQAQQDLQERINAEQALRKSEERYVLAIRGANDGLWDWDLKAMHIHYSPRWKVMLGYNEDEISNSPDEWFRRIHPEDIERTKLDLSMHVKHLTPHFENEHRMLHRDGSYRWMQSRGQALWDETGTAHRMAGSLTDITERKLAEQKLVQGAFFDTLTGLPNRTLFMDRLGYAVARARRRDDFLFAVLYLDLDRFKDINDSLGHMVGDELLISIAKTLHKNLRPMDTVARLGGDEFVILLEDIKDMRDATLIADRIQSELNSPFQLSNNLVFISTSIGIVLSQTGYHGPDEVVRDADIAMYRAKAKGKARYEIFDPAMRDRLLERLSLESELREAVTKEQLVVYYQPIVSLKDGRLCGLEALVRWNHPRRGLLPPVEFIPLAEETGLIISIDRYVIYHACKQMRQWQIQFDPIPGVSISVNLSGKHFSQPGLVEFIKQTLLETGLDGHCLQGEITESILMDNSELTVEMLRQLQELGIQIQIDDFGVGYSSLSYLARFPINAVKIDRSFVKKVEENTSNQMIIQSIMVLTNGLGMRVIAEGVETEGQLDRLRGLGCEYGQGAIVSMPIDPASITKLMEHLMGGFQSSGPQ